MNNECDVKDHHLPLSLSNPMSLLKILNLKVFYNCNPS